jgi:hypothetical protein
MNIDEQDTIIMLKSVVDKNATTVDVAYAYETDVTGKQDTAEIFTKDNREWVAIYVPITRKDNAIDENNDDDYCFEPGDICDMYISKSDYSIEVTVVEDHGDGVVDVCLPNNQYYSGPVPVRADKLTLKSSAVPVEANKSDFQIGDSLKLIDSNGMPDGFSEACSPILRSLKVTQISRDRNGKIDGMRIGKGEKEIEVPDYVLPHVTPCAPSDEKPTVDELLTTLRFLSR